ncbi:MAG TPA: TonB-dependent receptor [Steroidobacteraceae bacterium]
MIPFPGLKHPRRIQTLLLAGLMGAAVAPFALAQQAPEAPASAESSSDKLEEVVVSAQRRTENLQTTPIAITAITAASLEARNLDNISDVGAYVPNAVIAPLGAGWGSTMAAFIRGVGLGDNILSFEPGVPIYVDDVYIGRPQGSIFDLLDLERVEILRGPQGTLFGKNAEGGTVRLISVKPQGDNTGSVSLTYGKFNRVEARGMADVSLVDDFLYARFSFSSKKADGYFKNYDYVCENGAGSLGTMQPAIAPGSNCVTGTEGDENVQSGRAAFRFLLGTGIEFNLIADLTVQNQQGPADKYTVIDGTNGLNAGWGALTYAGFGTPTAGPAAYIGKPIAYDGRFITGNFYSGYSQYGTDPISGRNVPNINDLNHWGLAGTLDWKFSDDLSVKSVTAFREFRNQYGRDSDGSPLSENSTYDDAFHQQFTEEVTLTGKSGPLEWTTGGFYYTANDSDRGYDVLYPCTAQDPNVCIHEQDDYVSQITKNWAFFAHGVWHFTDAFSVTGGARYTSDEKDATITINNFDPVGGPFVNVNGQYVPTSARHTDYDISFNYQWDPDLMTYIRYSTGFKGGGFSPRPADALQTVPFAPEYLRTAELGEKSEFANNTIRFNSDFFYSRYLNQQTFAQQLDADGVNWFREENAGTARIWGLEGELQAEPIERLHLDASFGYVNYLLLSNGGNTLLFTGSNCNGETCYSPRTPKFTSALGVQYGLQIAGGTLTPRLDWTYQSKIYFVTNNGCDAEIGSAGCGSGAQGAYGVVNARLTWQPSGKKWEVAAWGRNLNDKEYFYGKLSLISFFGREQGNPAPPLEWGISFKRTFD